VPDQTAIAIVQICTLRRSLAASRAFRNTIGSAAILIDSATRAAASRTSVDADAVATGAAVAADVAVLAWISDREATRHASSLTIANLALTADMAACTAVLDIVLQVETLAGAAAGRVGRATVIEPADPSLADAMLAGIGRVQAGGGVRAADRSWSNTDPDICRGLSRATLGIRVQAVARSACPAASEERIILLEAGSRDAMLRIVVRRALRILAAGVIQNALAFAELIRAAVATRTTTRLTSAIAIAGEAMPA
jgi:hypothetical protein